MISYIKDKLKNEDGAIMITSALLLFVFLLFSALIINAGFIYINEQEAQSVADSASRAAALAGAKEGTSTTTTVILNSDAADRAADKIVEISKRHPTMTDVDDYYIAPEDYNDNHNMTNYNNGIYDVKISVVRTNRIQLFEPNRFSFKKQSVAEIYKK